MDKEVYESKKRIQKAKLMTANATKVFEIMKAMSAMKLTNEDNKPGRVLDRLFVGSIGCAYNEESLKNHEITHIVTVANKIKPRFEGKFVYKIIPVLDSASADIKQHFIDTNAYVKGVLDSDPKNRILIHCFAGKSRASTMTISYLI